MSGEIPKLVQRKTVQALEIFWTENAVLELQQDIEEWFYHHIFTVKIHKDFKTSELKTILHQKTNTDQTAEKKILSKTQTKLAVASLAGKKANVSMGNSLLEASKPAADAFKWRLPVQSACNETFAVLFLTFLRLQKVLPFQNIPLPSAVQESSTLSSHQCAHILLLLLRQCSDTASSRQPKS